MGSIDLTDFVADGEMVGRNGANPAGLAVTAIIAPGYRGVVGNGSTDDTTAIQAIITAAAGKVVWVTPATYAVQEIAVPSGTTVLAYGATFHRITSTDTASPLDATLHNATTSDVDIAVIGLRFTQAVNGRHLGFDSVDGLLVRDCVVDGLSNIWATWFRDCTDVVISGYRQNAGDGFGEDGLHITGGTGYTVTGCVIHSGDDAISLTSDTSDGAGDLRDVTITGCVLSSSHARPVVIDMAATADDGSVIERVNISNCVGYANGTLANCVDIVNQKASTCFVRDVTITGCWFAQPNTTSTLDGLYVLNVERFTCSDSTLYDLGRHGVHLKTVTDAVLNGVRVHGNTHTNGVGILVDDSDHARILGCTVRDSQSFGIQIGSSAASDWCRIVSCVVDNPTIDVGIYLHNSARSTIAFCKVTNSNEGIVTATGTGHQLFGNDLVGLTTPLNLAAGSATVEKVQVSARRMYLSAGTPTLAVVAGVTSVWQMDQTADESIVTDIVELPAHWTTFHIDVLYQNEGAGSGDVRFVPYLRQWSDGEVINPSPSLGTGTVQTAGAQRVQKVVRVASAVSKADTYLALEVYRQGSHGTDTLGNDIGILGVVFTYAS